MTDTPQADDSMSAASSASGLDPATAATRPVFRTALIGTGLVVAAVALGGCLIGGIVAGTAGVWGALIGAALAAFFCGVTSLTFLLTAGRPITVIMGAMMASWLVKTIVLVVVVMILKAQLDAGSEAFSPGVLFGTTVAGALGTLAVEWAVISRSRVPYDEGKS